MPEQADVEQENKSRISSWTSKAVAIVGATIALVPLASAESINFTPITELLDAVVGLIPSFMDLVERNGGILYQTCLRICDCTADRRDRYHRLHL